MSRRRTAENELQCAECGVGCGYLATASVSRSGDAAALCKQCVKDGLTVAVQRVSDRATWLDTVKGLERQCEDLRGQLGECWAERAAFQAAYAQLAEPKPVPMRIVCPDCGELHIDEGEFATKIHHTHQCSSYGNCWRPAVMPTVGVRFPFKSEVPT
jgi:hypothetical protein